MTISWKFKSALRDTENQELLKSELFSSRKHADAACPPGPLRKAAAMPALWPTDNTPAEPGLGIFAGALLRVSRCPKWSPLSSRPYMLEFWWPLCLGRKWWKEERGLTSALRLSQNHSIGAPRNEHSMSPDMPPDTLKFFSVGAQACYDRRRIVHSARHLKKERARVQNCAPLALRASQQSSSSSWQEIQATWYEKLHEWEDALVAYDKKMDTNKDDPELMLGRMRCLEALGEW